MGVGAYPIAHGLALAPRLPGRHAAVAALRHASAMPWPAFPSPVPRALSCGTVIVDPQGELLLCHVTGQDHWDLPKGGPDPGETPLQAALRETREETGLALDPDALLDLGRLPYRPRKDLHLFAALTPRLDPATLHCQSRFSDRRGQQWPEMDGFGWFPFDLAPLRVSPRMAVVLSQRLDLHDLLQRLQRAPARLAVVA
jgi:8-oxo-dGTP pyrophosphatase MutT (NUDIX family)